MSMKFLPSHAVVYRISVVEESVTSLCMGRGTLQLARSEVHADQPQPQANDEADVAQETREGLKQALLLPGQDAETARGGAGACTGEAEGAAEKCTSLPTVPVCCVSVSSQGRQ